MLTIVIVLFLVGLLAFANGANDNCKGVATLVGFGAARPREALIWATISTAVGSIVSFWFSGGLLKIFSVGLFESAPPLNGSFVIAVLAGAFGWVILATLTGLPVSTTHAITGALVGSGLMAFGDHQLQWAVLGWRFAVPLALGPLLSMAIVYAACWPVLFVVRLVTGRCVCVVAQPAPQIEAAGPAIAASATADVAVVAGSIEQCETSEPIAAVTGVSAANAIHWASGGFVGFARGWNDAPKIAALGIVALGASDVAHGTVVAFAVVTVAMAAGGLLAGRRVLETLARKLTPMPLAESLTASLTTASLVSAASWFGLPVSTTHVSTGAIIGAGLKNDPRAVRWGKVREIVLSWIVTLPAAGLLAAAVVYLIG